MTTTDDNGYKPELEVLVNMKCMFIFNLEYKRVYTVTIIYGDNILRIGGIEHFARIKFCAYAACASGVALLFHAHARALVRQWYAHKKTA